MMNYFNILIKYNECQHYYKENSENNDQANCNL